MDPTAEITTKHGVPRNRLAPERASEIRRSPPTNMTVLEAATYAGCSPRKLRDLITDRKVRCARIGKKVIVRREAIDEFLTVAA